MKKDEMGPKETTHVRHEAGTENKLKRLQDDFAKAKTLDVATKLVWGDRFLHDYYQHYTTLDALVRIFVSGRFKLTSSVNERLNDLQEMRKFGNYDLLKRTYQASFSHRMSESASMWALYSRKDPFAVRVTIPKDKMERWINSLADKKQSQISDDKGAKIANALVDFHDIVYAAVASQDADRYSIKRSDTLQWMGKTTSRIGKLRDKIKDDKVTGWMKDCEWEQERESRLCVTFPNQDIGADAIFVDIPDEVLFDMRFTYSPWLARDQEDKVKSILQALHESYASGKDEKGKAIPQYYRRSSVQGALNIRM